MVIKVIERVNTEDWKRQSACRVCTSKLEYRLSDLTKNDENCLYSCPVCHQTNWISLTDIPSCYHFAIKTQHTGIHDR